MKRSLAQLTRIGRVDSIILHALDLSLYRASVLIDGEEFSVADNDGRTLTSHSGPALQMLLESTVQGPVMLRQQSAYDEMIGQQTRQGVNTLEVPLGTLAPAGNERIATRH